MKRVFLFIGLIAIMSSCKEEVDQQAVDREIILQYIADNNLNANEGAEGLFYVIEDEGTGDVCNSNSIVKASYIGYLTDGTVFDQGTIDTFNLLNAIRGWQIGMDLLREGGEAKLLIPSALGYGETGSSSGSIPPNAVIIFDVELIKVY